MANIRNYELPSTNMIVGSGVDTSKASHVVLTIEDLTVKPKTIVNNSPYVVQVLGYYYKGITDKDVVIEGNDKVTKYERIFGKPNTSLYGPGATLALEAINAGFNLSTFNVRSEEATFPNYYIAFTITDKPTVNGVPSPTALTKILYVWHDTVADKYYIAGIQSDLPPEALPAEIIEVECPIYQYQHSTRYMADAKSLMEIQPYLTTPVADGGSVVDTVDPVTTVTPENVHIPYHGLIYNGRSEYGNYFKTTYKTLNSLIDEKYLLFENKTIDSSNNNLEMLFNFSFSQYQSVKTGQKLNYPILVTQEGSVDMEVNNNSVELFTGFTGEKKTINKIKTTADACVTKTLNSALAAIKVAFPLFDETAETMSNWQEVVDATKLISDTFTYTNPINENALSYCDPFKELPADPLTLGNYIPASTTIYMAGGTDELATELHANGYDINKTEVPSLPGKPIFPDLFEKYYTGVLTDTIYEPAITRAALVLGEGYPNDLQEAICKLTAFKPEMFNVENVRADWLYIRTPDESQVKTLDDVITWGRGFVDPNNPNCKTFIGSWNFYDESDAQIHRFSCVYDWLGVDGGLYPALISGTPDSFASGTHSKIRRAERNSHNLVPTGSSTYRDTLYDLDINFYTNTLDRGFALSEDTSGNRGYESMLKSLISCINFNSIANTTYLYMRDNKITRPTISKFNNMVADIRDLSAQYIKHFANGVKIEVKLDDNPYSVGTDVVLAHISVSNNKYSRYARVLMSAVDSI